jgi:4'-phosphopantetheinyl transferase
VTEIYGIYMNRLLRIDEFEHMLLSVSEERQAKVNRFKKPEDANRGLIGELLIRDIIRSKFQLTNSQITFRAQQYGKPSVAGIPSFHFNIAHSGSWIVCAVDNKPVGIDIEEIHPISLDIAKFVFSSEEYRFLMEKPLTERVSCFYELWTLKESFIKQIGKGLSIPLHSFSIHREAEPTSPYKLEETAYAPCFFKKIHVDPHYKMAVCSTSGLFSEQLNVKSVDDLILQTYESDHRKVKRGP